ncbi:unnamed protein product [Staurois parvus]|uniref:Uncharacterized protein n=1 Tax=Staurois parvus TaxID=386267 RepID=A0ABN9D881_9NEOB|nr:unnamed protein product [Staurois parvus]
MQKRHWQQKGKPWLRMFPTRGLVQTRARLTTHGAPGNKESWGPCVLAQTQKSL